MSGMSSVHLPVLTLLLRALEFATGIGDTDVANLMIN